MTIASVDRTIRLISTGKTDGSTCTPDLAVDPWYFDDKAPGYGPGSSMGDVIPTGSPRQGELPAKYRTASNGELGDWIRAAKATLGD
ncbi:MAG: quinolinate synthase NadA, partial [Cryobacterium sp.]